MAAIVAHHALGTAGRAGRIQYIERVGGRDRHGVVRGGGGLRFQKVVVTAGRKLGPRGLALENEAGFRLMRGEADRGVEQRLVFHDPPRFEPARGGDDDAGLGVRDTRGELGRGEPAEHDGVDRTKPGAGEHRNDRLRHHRHVNDDAVARLDAKFRQRARDAGRAVEEAGIGEGLDAPGHRAVPDQGGLIAASGGHVAVEAVDRSVEPGTREPAAERTLAGIEGAVPFAVPEDPLRGLLPPGLGPLLPVAIDALIRAHGVLSLGVAALHFWTRHGI